MPDEPEDPGKGRLLPGEPGSSGSANLGDMRQWVGVYRELYGFKRHLLDEISIQQQEVLPPGSAELENDRRVLEKETERVGRRLRYWEGELERRGGS